MTYKTIILRSGDETRWKNLVEKADTPDIYFTPEYIKIYEKDYNPVINESFCGEATLFFFGNEDEYVILPFLKRNINNFEFLKKEGRTKQLYDIISPYGYSGPLIRCKDERKKGMIKGFIDALEDYCIENDIITGFFRFHPLLKNHELIQDFEEVEEKNNTVYIDLTLPKEELLRNLNKKTRNLIKKAEKEGVTIEILDPEKYIGEFTELYLGTMRKNTANERYYLPKEFFENTVRLLKENIILVGARYEGNIISASLFMHKYHFMHYHFSASDKSFLKLSPNNLLLWKTILWGKEKGYKKMHLGGGITNDANDSLFHFKAGFSKATARYYQQKRIYDNNLYKELCELKFMEEKGKKSEINNFFPGYRK